jgi:transposase
LDTIWEVPDALWEKIVKPVLDEFDPPKRVGRPRADQRKCRDGIIFRARTGCQCNKLPKEFGDDATVHRTLQRRDKLGIFDRLWALLIYHCQALGGVHGQWQAADGCLNKARFIGKRGNSTAPQNKQGKKPNEETRVSKGTLQPRKRRKTVRSGSVPTPRTGESWASKTACLSRETAARLLS